MRENVCCLCGKPESKVNKLIAGPSGNFVCDECIDSCNTMLANELEEFAPDFGDSELEINLKTPHEIKAFLDEYVIGQDDAKKVLSVAVYNHYKRIVSNGNSESKVELQKSNVLMLGPTGSGKTYLVQNLARILGVPFCIADATSLTEAGYVGEDVETILLKLIQAADYDIKKAEIGIVYIDEIDKIAKKTESVSTSRDVSGEGVQQALLKLIEGTTANIPQQGERKHPGKDLMQMDTKNVLFICGGAFVGIDEIIKKRLDETYPEEKGKERTFDELFSSAMPHDFIKFGLIPEFIGRVPVTVSLNQLSENDMVHILREPKNSIVKQYQELFKMDGVDLKFNPDALREIAKKTIERHTGARGLRSIVETVMMDYMYDIPSDPSIKTLTITKEMIDQNLKDKIHK